MNQRNTQFSPLPVRLAVLLYVIPAGLAGLGTAQAQPALPNVPQTSPLQHMLQEKPPALGAGLPNFQPPATGAPLPVVDIPVRSVAIVGATAFPAASLNALTSGLAGTVPLAKIEASRRALVELYRSHGFVFTTVSMDIDSAGNVRFIVTESRIAAVKLSQDIGPAGTLVLGFLNHLSEERPLNEASLERWLLLAQQVPGVSVHAVLQADASDPGALTLIAEVSKQNVSALLTADNRGFTNTGPTEGLAVLDLNSVTSFGDQTEVSIFHTSGGTDNFGQAAESFFIGSHGLRIRLYGGAGRSNPSGVLSQIGYQSSITVFGAQLSYPLLLQRNQALNVSARFDGIDNNIKSLGASLTSDSLRVARLDGQYAWQDLWAGNTREALNIFNLRESQGIPYFGASADNRTAPPAGRDGEKMEFWKLSGSAGRTQTLFSPFPQASVALRLEAGGQYTSDILPSEEEFYLGGSRFARGFYSGQVVGDKGVYATSELQLNTGYSFSALSHDIDLGSQFYFFSDWGETWSNLKTDLNGRVASFGGGVRLGLTRALELDGEVVRRLTTQLTPAANGTPALADTVLYGGITATY
jgi:hemolysin activation/secretion protein